MTDFFLPGRVTEAAPTGEERGKGRDNDYGHRLQGTPHPSRLLQVPWEIHIGVGKLLTGGGEKTTEGAAEVDKTS